MASDNQGQYPDYPVFKGLQKPLDFWVCKEGISIGQPAQLVVAFSAF